jgi:flagellar P-ring protein precursor FlgI
MTKGIPMIVDEERSWTRRRPRRGVQAADLGGAVRPRRPARRGFRSGAVRRALAAALALTMTVALLAFSAPVQAARIKDIATFEGVRGNQLLGYGLVVGLNGTGDGSQSAFTPQSLSNMLRRLGIVVDPDKVRVKNVAAVMVTAEAPPFSRSGRTIDVTVSSIGDSKSLSGGTLLLTPLRGPDGTVYASAQGMVSVGGAFSASAGGASSQRNHPTAGRIPGGAFLERDIVFELGSRRDLRLLLRDPDFTTAARIEKSLNDAFGPGTAKAEDSGGVAVRFPEAQATNQVDFLSRIEDVSVDPDSPARLVFNEKTGTVVMGADLRISRVAISHGNLSIQVENAVQVSQPEAFSKGETVVTDQPTIQAKEEPARVLVLDQGASIGELVKGLNRIGATARDMIAIFQAIRAAGALQAEIIVQ